MPILQAFFVFFMFAASSEFEFIGSCIAIVILGLIDEFIIEEKWDV